MLSIGLGHYLTLAAIIFTIGIVGIFLNRKNIIVILMSIELILTANNISSILIKITIIFFLFKKIPIIPMLKITAPKVK